MAGARQSYAPAKPYGDVHRQTRTSRSRARRSVCLYVAASFVASACRYAQGERTATERESPKQPAAGAQLPGSRPDEHIRTVSSATRHEGGLAPETTEKSSPVHATSEAPRSCPDDMLPV